MRRRSELKLQLPGLTHKVVTEALARLSLDKVEAAFDINSPSRQQAGIDPQRHFFVALLSRKRNALITQLAAQAQPPRFGLKDQYAQLRRGF